MKRMSVSKRRVSVLPSGFVALPVPCTSETPTNPLKSQIDDGSMSGPKNVKWKSTPPTLVALIVGFGAALDALPASTVAGNSPAPAAAPATPAIEPMKALRDRTWRMWWEPRSDGGGRDNLERSAATGRMASPPVETGEDEG